MSFPKNMRHAIEHGRSLENQMGAEYGPHTFECLYGPCGRILCHYMQGMLMNIWHIESGKVWRLPCIWDQPAYSAAATAFVRAARQLWKEGMS